MTAFDVVGRIVVGAMVIIPWLIGTVVILGEMNS